MKYHNFYQKNTKRVLFSLIFGLLVNIANAGIPITDAIHFGKFHQQDGSAEADLFVTAIDDPDDGLYFVLTFEIKGISEKDVPFVGSQMIMKFRKYNDTYGSILSFPSTGRDIKDGSYFWYVVEDSHFPVFFEHYYSKGYYNPIAGIFYINWDGDQIRFLNSFSDNLSIPYDNFKYLMRKINEYYGYSDDPE